jgi:hypothetical protein
VGTFPIHVGFCKARGFRKKKTHRPDEPSVVVKETAKKGAEQLPNTLFRSSVFLSAFTAKLSMYRSGTVQANWTKWFAG